MKECLKCKLQNDKYSENTLKLINAYCVGKGYYEYDEIDESLRDDTFEKFIEWDKEQDEKEILMSIFDTITEVANNTDDLNKIDLCIAQLDFLKEQFNLD